MSGLKDVAIERYKINISHDDKISVGVPGSERNPDRRNESDILRILCNGGKCGLARQSRRAPARVKPKRVGQTRMSAESWGRQECLPHQATAWWGRHSCLP